MGDSNQMQPHQSPYVAGPEYVSSSNHISGKHDGDRSELASVQELGSGACGEREKF